MKQHVWLSYPVSRAFFPVFFSAGVARKQGSAVFASGFHCACSEALHLVAWLHPNSSSSANYFVQLFSAKSKQIIQKHCQYVYLRMSFGPITRT